jgi:hypothetical protein
MKPQATFSLSVKLWLQSDIYTWAAFSWIQWKSGNFAKEQGSPELVSDFGAKRARF